MKELIRPVPIEIVDLGIETHAQIEIEEILLTSFPPIQKTILTKLSKNSPTSSGSEMNCGAEHKCSKESCK